MTEPDDYTLSEPLHHVLRNLQNAPHWNTASDALVVPMSRDPAVLAALPEVQAMAISVKAKPDAAEKARRKSILSHDDQMTDAQGQCVPCRLCGGAAVISDAGPGYGYSIECENAARFKRPTCLQSGTRISGWAYNVSDLWNTLNATQMDPSAATAALARIEREAEARGRVKGLREAAEWYRADGWKIDEDDVPDAILARADQIEKDAK